MTCESCGHENLEGARFCAGCGALLPIDHEGADPLVGQIIGGRYRVTRVLGEGGMGVVYEGEQQMGSTVRKVAIKTLHQHLSKDPSVLARFHRECGTVAQLEHPNTIKFYDFGATADGTLYIAMEFVAGHPLSGVLERERKLPPERVLTILRQVCGVLDEAHKQGIIHRDLKPDNIILTDRAGERDFVKVLDFGIAARTESADAAKEQKLTQQGMVLGTPPYMSPEQFTGKALDQRSDIYSLAVVAYEMLTGRLPFDADTPWQWATQHMTVQPIPFEVSAPSDAIPGGMRSAILKALAKEREQRQSSAREFFVELSEGGRMTEQGEAVEEARPRTAAMEAAPDFGAGGMAPAAGLAQPVAHAAPAYAGQGYGPLGYQAGAPHPGPPLPGPPVPGQGAAKAKGGKGLIIGLSAFGAILLVAMVVIAARSMKPDAAEEQTLANPFTTASAVATIAPQVDTTASTPATQASAAPETQKPDSSEVATGKASTGTPSTGQTRPSTGSASSPGSGSGSGDACAACESAASSGNLVSAASSFRNCSDPSRKNKCAALVRAKAPVAARSAAFNGNCAQAQAIVRAAEAMGAASPVLTNAVATCK